MVQSPFAFDRIIGHNSGGMGESALFSSQKGWKLNSLGLFSTAKAWHKGEFYVHAYFIDWNIL